MVCKVYNVLENLLWKMNVKYIANFSLHAEMIIFWINWVKHIKINFSFLPLLFVFLWTHSEHMEVPGPGTESELHLWPLPQLWQCWILYPTASGWGLNSHLHSDLSHCSQFLTHCTTTPLFYFLKWLPENLEMHIWLIVMAHILFLFTRAFRTWTDRHFL